MIRVYSCNQPKDVYTRELAIIFSKSRSGRDVPVRVRVIVTSAVTDVLMMSVEGHQILTLSLP